MRRPPPDRPEDFASREPEKPGPRQFRESPDPGGALLRKLQTTLDAHLLLEIVRQHLQSELGEIGLVLRLADRSVLCWAGQAMKHSVTHRFSVDDEDFEEVTVHRSRAFSTAQTTLLHETLRLLEHPLHNAIHYLEARRQARSDPLTGLSNRAALGEALEREVNLARRHEHGFSLTIIDIDFFKTINDTYGHSAGDSVLRQFAEVLRATSRRSDLLFRFGGDEFVLGTNHTEDDGAVSIAERFLKALAGTEFHHGRELLTQVHASVGIATLRPDESGESLFDRADQALYAAKKQGRSRIVIDREPVLRQEAVPPTKSPSAAAGHNGDVVRVDRKTRP